jgi:type I restriction enzyme S subunit
MILNDKTSVGTIIGKVLLIDTGNKYVFNQRTMRLRIKTKVLSKYLYYLINSDEIHNKIITLAKPGTQIYINTDDILNLKVFFPSSINEQFDIAKVLSDMDNEIETLELKLSKYRLIKQGIMQELLTGKKRLI